MPPPPPACADIAEGANWCRKKKEAGKCDRDFVKSECIRTCGYCRQPPPPAQSPPPPPPSPPEPQPSPPSPLVGPKVEHANACRDAEDLGWCTKRRDAGKCNRIAVKSQCSLTC
eukprot:1155852-Prymnesium_polylepis.1